MKDNTCTNGGSNENEAPQAQKAMVDASKLNEPMTNLDKRLAGGLNGDYYESGSKLDDKHRHGQLESVFGLRKELSEIKITDGEAAEPTGRSPTYQNLPKAHRKLVKA